MGSTTAMSKQQRKAMAAEVRADAYPKKSPKRDEKGRAIWPRMPAKPQHPRGRPASRPSGRVAPNKGDKRSDLEVLSRLAGGTTYRTPGQVRSTQPSSITTDDIAAALGYVKDPLEQRLALALSCHTVGEWPSIEVLAHAPLLRQLVGSHNTRKLVTGKARHRARLILAEVFHDLALVRFPRATKEMAEQLKMTQRDYREIYRATAGFLETKANAGAYVACQALHEDV